MKKLDIRFDTEKVNADLDWLGNGLLHNKSEIARAAMNIGIDKLRFYAASKQPAMCSKLVEEFKAIDSAVVTKDIK